MKIALPSIEHNQAGFEALVGLYAQIQECSFETIEVTLPAWLDADMCAPLGAILYWLGQNANSIRLNVPHPRVEAILSKNGFLSHYGRLRLPDKWGTTIRYQRFDVKDDRYFGQYIETRLMQRKVLYLDIADKCIWSCDRLVG